jgi:regulator of sigma E protease
MPEILQTLQNVLLYPISFVLVLSAVVFVHEFGHFQVARWRGVAIDTFSIGFGKALAHWRDKQGVEWKIGVLPLGGYVKFADDVDAMSSAPRERLADPEALAAARAKGFFHAQPVLTRVLVVAAGPVSNFIFAILAFSLHILVTGRDVTDYETTPTLIVGVMEGSAAAEAGLRAGEVVESVNGAPVRGNRNFQAIVTQHPGQSLSIVLQSEDGARRTVTATPRASMRGVIQVGTLGVALSVREQDRVIQRVNPIEAVGFGAASTWAIITSTVDYIGGIFSGENSGRDIAGPLGILNVSGQVATASLDAPSGTPGGPVGALLLALLSLTAVLSVAVGFINLMPIPLLDGGHLLFYFVEALRGGKPIPAAAQEWAYRAGFAVVASLFLFATWNDITRLLPGAQ